MSLKKIDVRTLDQILEKMINTVDSSKSEIFQIGEQCRQEYETLSDELKEVKVMVSQVIDEGEDLEVKTRQSRRRLSIVSQHFRDYTEEQVREAYEIAHNYQMKYSMNLELEKQLRRRRDELERRLIHLEATIDRANNLVSQTSVVLNYLTSDLKEIGSALEDAKEKQDFGLRVIEAQEEERKRLSREIHDGPAQMLANMLLRSDLVEKVYREQGIVNALEEVKSLKKMVRSSLSEVRRIIYDLRPMALDDLGLVPTLRKYLERTEEYNSGVTFRFINLGQEYRLPSKYEVALFRLVQESVQNAIKHAQASEIHVKIDMQQDSVFLIVKDNGKGFDVREKKEGSFGIMGMRERVEIIDGKITIDSKIGEGTIVMIQVKFD
ncbi:sensor histidine kinase [Heyndrickxia oleronia]|uniref:Signal transduction histidine-protein kinase/phosphatase DegS n=1 Tax=Heyndrickxia oleronia TaxID=38875 RepID=A0A8E2LGC1_9BACI|nr:sensor histidine kinase [Heyndrickxia oleronia]NYV66134.1 sensor histidine kinase [Bacillus sp. Gen3]MCI1591817.1 sensor histidine kinase [Heyndrickxia oleronia]MCI1615074.1 sensor histidine kinase [Heyndrickxia oleronia]MCI1745941.1 sensor histidine kinase [Heyndrickxia oleronia]MCM3457444.1 sensor histidine kinase [Heyndrickxia oleronia]